MLLFVFYYFTNILACEKNLSEKSNVQVYKYQVCTYIKIVELGYLALLN